MGREDWIQDNRVKRTVRTNFTAATEISLCAMEKYVLKSSLQMESSLVMALSSCLRDDYHPMRI